MGNHVLLAWTHGRRDGMEPDFQSGNQPVTAWLGLEHAVQQAVAWLSVPEQAEPGLKQRRGQLRVSGLQPGTAASATRTASLTQYAHGGGGTWRGPCLESRGGVLDGPAGGSASPLAARARASRLASSAAVTALDWSRTLTGHPDQPYRVAGRLHP